jgi:hypothetical protein
VRRGGVDCSVRQEEHPHLRADWLWYRWSAWMPLNAAHPLALAQLPLAPGLYRVRRADSPAELEWVGWADRGVREVVERLSRQVHLPVAPYDDPDSPALALWQLRRQGTSLEVSGAAVESGGVQLAQSVWNSYRANRGQ